MSASWAPTWSPDGQSVAFYSDEGGSARLWIWDKSTRKAERFPGAIVRPFFGWELPKWSADGQSVLCKILPEAQTIAEANALSPLPKSTRQFPAHDAGTPGVLVLRSAHQGAGSISVLPAFSNRLLADLALLDLRNHQLRRLAEQSQITWYAFSPDQLRVAYAEVDGWPQSGPVYAVKVVDLASGRTRTLGHSMGLYYGVEASWSPDSQSIALIDRDAKEAPRLSILPADGSSLRPFPQVPNVTLLDRAPRWSPDGRSLYAAAGDGELWQFDTRSGAGRRIARIEGIEIESLVSRFDQTLVWSTDRGRQLWAFGRRESDNRPYLLRIDALSGVAKAEALPDCEIEGLPSIDANEASGEIAFVAKDQQHPGDVWVYDTHHARARQVSHLNRELERYALGEAGVINFQASDGKALHAALLLPPDYRPGRPLPTVVWVYGGRYGSQAVRTFGFEDQTALWNMHVLATRGYAIVFPDAPITEGMPTKSLVDTVLPAVDAAIAQGYADSNRLAVMGQSFGAYSVLALISHTERFKAAITTANVIHPDLLASYLEMELDGSSEWPEYFEHGQGALGGSPWQARERYLDNSPIYRFDKITTPLLMGQGAEDGALSAPDATFVALRHLDKKVEYRIYEGEGHAIQRKANVVDFWNRRLEFLAEHLNAAGRN
jgi:dipeptidyl aminopeptidase/acylaminoacyl peptidase